MKIFDAHFHIIDYNYHIQENNGYTPEEFTYSDYAARTEALDLDVQGGAIISGSFQGFDTDYLQVIEDIKNKDAKEDFVGIIALPLDVTERKIKELDSIGVAGVRFNIFRGNSASITDLVEFSKRIHAIAGWHVEVQINPDELGTIKGQLKEIPRLSIDHIGLRKSGIEHLYDLADSGVKIKASGFGRLDFEPMPILSNIHHINKNCLMFGTDLPSTRVQADKAFSETHIKKMTETFLTEDLADIMFNNAYNWYIKKT